MNGSLSATFTVTPGLEEDTPGLPSEQSLSRITIRRQGDGARHGKACLEDLDRVDYSELIADLHFLLE